MMALSELAQEHYELLISQSMSSKRKHSIQAVWRALETLARVDGTVSVAVVGQLCVEQSGGPRAQSIRNDREGLRKLVELASSRRNRRTATGRAPSTPYGWVEEINDAETGARVAALAHHAKLLAIENDRLRAGTKRLKAIGEFTEFLAMSEDLPAVSPPPVRWTKQERDAVLTFLKGLEEEGLTIDETSNEIVSRSGRTVAPPEFLQALNKMLAANLEE